MKSAIDPEGRRLPVKIDTTSNGEFEPVPLPSVNRMGNRLAHQAVSANAKRSGMSRREFLVSACGAASALIAFNAANAAAARRGGFFELESAAALDPQLAQARVSGKGEFIFDVQGHFVDPTGAWVKKRPPMPSSGRPKRLAGAPGNRASAAISLASAPKNLSKTCFSTATPT
jgi:hypothetical protein